MGLSYKIYNLALVGFLLCFLHPPPLPVCAIYSKQGFRFVDKVKEPGEKMNLVELSCVVKDYWLGLRNVLSGVSSFGHQRGPLRSPTVARCCSFIVLIISQKKRNESFSSGNNLGKDEQINWKYINIPYIYKFKILRGNLVWDKNHKIISWSLNSPCFLFYLITNQIQHPPPKKRLSKSIGNKNKCRRLPKLWRLDIKVISELRNKSNFVLFDYLIVYQRAYKISVKRCRQYPYTNTRSTGRHYEHSHTALFVTLSQLRNNKNSNPSNTQQRPCLLISH